MKYRKKPVVIEAIQWTGKNSKELHEFVNHDYYFMENVPVIITLEGNMEASINDYIIKGVNCEFYPCKPDIFEKTYEIAE